MSHISPLPVFGVVLAFLPFALRAEVLLVDDFNAYNNVTLIGNNLPIQSNPGGASGIAGSWTRFGNATADGIYSIAGGIGGTRGASYSTDWSKGANGYIHYTFASTHDFSLLDEISLNLYVGTVVAGTTVSVQIRSGSTYYQTAAPLSLVNTAYSTFSFDASATGLTRVAGTASYEDVVGAVSSIVFVFSNSGGSGTQAIRFDQFEITTIPEPGTFGIFAMGGASLVGLRFLRRRRF